MVLTFPNMGNVSLAAAALCQGLEIAYVRPEPNSKEALQTGSEHSPEEICLPFKYMLGNFIQSIEKGADTVLITGSCGPCRFGEYCELQMKLLKKIGYNDIDFVVADLSSEIGLAEFKRRISKISDASPVSPIRKVRALHNAYRIVELSDSIDADAHYLAGYEVTRGECKKLLYECKRKVLQSESPEETIKLLTSYRKKLSRIETDLDRTPIKVAIIGEIFTIIDPTSNLFIEDKLMDYGVSSVRTLSPSWWVRDIIMKPLKLNSLAINAAAKKYMPYPVGGHGKECIGEAAIAKADGMDGAIQIFPMGCMPEVVAKSILPAIQRDTDCPVMTLIVDETTGEAGYITRIEAFIDMLKSRRKMVSSVFRNAVNS